jgi:PKD repeat protein
VNRRYVILAITQLVILAFAVARVQADLPTPILAIEPAEYKAKIIGETFDVNVTIINIHQDWRLITPEFRVLYDNTSLEVVDVKEGPFMQQFPNYPLGEGYGKPTYFIVTVDEQMLWYGPNVHIAILLWPAENVSSKWYNFPQGNGTLATITFRTIRQTAAPGSPVTSMLTLDDTLLVDDSIGEIPHEIMNAQYEMEPISFSYEPSIPFAGKPVFFTVPEATHTVAYSWNFGDETSTSVTANIVGHVYSTPGVYNVTLTCTSYGFNSSTATKAITVSAPQPTIDVAIDAGSIHFNEEVVEFNILVTSQGETIDATKIEAVLYISGIPKANLTSAVLSVDTGFYVIPYGIPADAPAGTYTLIVKAEYYNAVGTNLKSFQVSPTLTAEIRNIENEIAAVSNGLTDLRLNLTAINATISGLIKGSEGTILAQISTSVGTLTAKLDTINATITRIDGNTATLQTTLGEVKTKLGETQSTATTMLYATAVLSAIAVILAAAILMSTRKK